MCLAAPSTLRTGASTWSAVQIATCIFPGVRTVPLHPCNLAVLTFAAEPRMAALWRRNRPACRHATVAHSNHRFMAARWPAAAAAPLAAGLPAPAFPPLLALGAFAAGPPKYLLRYCLARASTESVSSFFRFFCCTCRPPAPGGKGAGDGAGGRAGAGREAAVKGRCRPQGRLRSAIRSCAASSPPPLPCLHPQSPAGPKRVAAQSTRTAVICPSNPLAPNPTSQKTVPTAPQA